MCELVAMQQPSYSCRTISGSEQEFDKRPISRGFPENHEFGFGDSHTLSLEEQIT
jgi:hypothetical protein